MSGLALSCWVCSVLIFLQLPGSCKSFASVRNDLRLASTGSFMLQEAGGGDNLSGEQSKEKPNVRKLSRPERKALERQKKQRKNDSQKRSQARAKYNLHSNAVSELSTDSGPDDVIRAIKRAQKMHDDHDIAVIANFLLEECDESFAYGYRGSLLARLAVAALHFGNHKVARRAISVRRLEHRPTMLPMESAAIIRGLLRNKNATEAMEVLHDELKLPLEVRQFD